jgi:hypothetical protein
VVTFPIHDGLVGRVFLVDWSVGRSQVGRLAERVPVV